MISISVEMTNFMIVNIKKVIDLKTFASFEREKLMNVYSSTTHLLYLMASLQLFESTFLVNLLHSYPRLIWTAALAA